MEQQYDIHIYHIVKMSIIQSHSKSKQIIFLVENDNGNAKDCNNPGNLEKEVLSWKVYYNSYFVIKL